MRLFHINYRAMLIKAFPAPDVRRKAANANDVSHLKILRKFFNNA